MEKGDFVTIEFTGRIAHSGELFDLTSAEEAKKHNIYNPKHKYGPVLVIVGAHMVVPGLEQQLEEMKSGEERTFTLKPEDAFGKRDVRLIKIFSLAKFTKEKINPAPGMFVEINHTKAKIQSVSGGRVRVDFNHPLAGKEVSYTVKIVKQLTVPQEKLTALLDYYGLASTAVVKEHIAEITTKHKLDDGLKKLLTETIQKWIPSIKKVSFPVEVPVEKSGASKT